MPASKWTFLVFINGENDLLPHAIAAYNELAAIGCYENMNLIAFVDFPTFYIDDDIQSDEYAFLTNPERWKPSLYEVRKNEWLENATPFAVAEHWYEDNLYNTDHFSNFISLAIKAYPAEHYAFSYKSHGGKTTDIKKKFIEFRLLRLRDDEIEITPASKAVSSPDLKFLTYGLVQPLENFLKKTETIHTIESFNLKDSGFKFQIPFNKNKSEAIHPDAVGVRVYIDQEKVLSRLQQQGHYQNAYWELALENAIIPDESKPNEVIIGFAGINSSELSFKALAIALKKGFAGHRIDITLMDCCWGMSIDMAVLFGEICDYYIASEDESPARGIGYDVLFKSLSERPGQWLQPAELARMIPATFYSKRYDDYLNFEDITDLTFFHYGVSFTAISCRNLQSCLSLFKSFCDCVLISQEEGKHPFDVLQKARNKCNDFTYFDDAEAYAMYNVDLIWVLENIIYYIDEEAQYKNLAALKESCYKLIINIRLYLIEGFVGNNYKKADLTKEEKQRESKGIGLIFPETPAQYKNSLLASEKVVGFNFGYATGWNKVLKTYYRIVNK